MRQFLKALILLPVAMVVVLLAVANRAPVTLSFDPFSKPGPQFSRPCRSSRCSSSRWRSGW